VPEYMGQPIEVQLFPPQGDMRLSRSKFGGKATIVNVIRIPGLRKGRYINLKEHPSYPTMWVVAGMAPVRTPQASAYHVGEMR
jgi:hypothetical protein